MTVGEKVEVVSERDSGVKWPVHCESLLNFQFEVLTVSSTYHERWGITDHRRSKSFMILEVLLNK